MAGTPLAEMSQVSSGTINNIVNTQKNVYSAAVPQILVTWVGKTDLRAATESAVVGLGPIAQALTSRSFDDVFLLTDYPASDVKPFLRWLMPQSSARLHVLHESLA